MENENSKPDGGIILDGAVRLVSESNVGKSYECNLCKEGTPHMMVVLSKSGDMHVHAPFSNRYLMNQMMEAIIDEQKKYGMINKYENIK